MNEQDTSNNEKYVLYADIMGFKERVMRTKHEDLKKELKKLRKKLYLLSFVNVMVILNSCLSMRIMSRIEEMSCKPF